MLAAGVTPLEIGSDIGGSLRHPANFCGVYALKPTFGALSMRGQVPPGPGPYVARDLGVAGPMARSAADLRLLWDVLRGGPAVESSPVAGARVALWLDEPEFVVSEEVRVAVLAAADALRGQGVTVEVAAAPVAPAALLDTYLALLFPIVAVGFPAEVFAALVAASTDAQAAPAAGAGRYGPEAFAWYATASYRDVARAQVARELLEGQLADWFGGWDAVLTPISPVTAFPHQHEGTLADRLLEVDGGQVPYLRLLDWIAPATALHAPALAVPVTRTFEGCRWVCS